MPLSQHFWGFLVSGRKIGQQKGLLQCKQSKGRWTLVSIETSKMLDWKSKWNSSMLKYLLNPYLSKIVSSNNAIKKRHQEFSIFSIWVTVLLKQFSLSIWCPLSCKSTPTLKFMTMYNRFQRCLYGKITLSGMENVSYEWINICFAFIVQKG